MAIVGYKLRVNGGSLTNQVIDVGNVLIYTITGLDAATEYAVEVAAYDENDALSLYSPAVLATTDPAPALYVVFTEADEAAVDKDGAPLTVLM